MNKIIPKKEKTGVLHKKGCLHPGFIVGKPCFIGKRGYLCDEVAMLEYAH
jgi:hypothetical protein